MELHETGYAWRFIREFNPCRWLSESVAKPWWSLLGASMTLVGILPPLCDNGNMLVDGGYREFLTFFYGAIAGTHYGWLNSG